MLSAVGLLLALSGSAGFGYIKKKRKKNLFPRIRDFTHSYHHAQTLNSIQLFFFSLTVWCACLFTFGRIGGRLTVPPNCV